MSSLLVLPTISLKPVASENDLFFLCKKTFCSHHAQLPRYSGCNKIVGNPHVVDWPIGTCNLTYILRLVVVPSRVSTFLLML